MQVDYANVVEQVEQNVNVGGMLVRQFDLGCGDTIWVVSKLIIWTLCVLYVCVWVREWCGSLAPHVQYCNICVYVTIYVPTP